MLQPLKMQEEARNREKRCFARFERACTHCAHRIGLENLTNCPLLIATHSYFYASTLTNARGSQKLRKEAFWHALRATVRAALAGSA